MANIKILFQGTERSKTELRELEAFANSNHEIFISIKYPGHYASYICLDRPTAIRLVRELKKQIGFLMESEVENG